MKKLLKKVITGAVVAAGMMSGASGGSTYTFTVTCADRAQVVEWAAGNIDPGREFLRSSTSTHFPGCSVNDYRDGDAALPRIRYSYGETILQVAPVIGEIVNNLIN